MPSSGVTFQYILSSVLVYLSDNPPRKSPIFIYSKTSETVIDLLEDNSNKRIEDNYKFVSILKYCGPSHS